MSANLTRRRFLRSCALLAAGACGAMTLAGCVDRIAIPSLRDVARLIIDNMTLEQKAAQLFILTPDQIVGRIDAITSADEVFAEAFEEHPVCGFNFFEGNLVDDAQAKAFVADIKSIAASNSILPPLCCVDEEGGTVRRISGRSDFGVDDVGNMSEIGVGADAKLAADAARMMAAGLRGLGLDVDFAPSCDIATSPQSDMRLRSFGADASLVAQMDVAQVEAFEQSGIICCAKHFPGIGDPEADSHDFAISTNRTREELSELLIPFEATIQAGVPMIMVGHIALPQITGSYLPASISPDIVQGILRDELGYDGVVSTDSLGMQALLDFCDPADVGIAAMEAGCDIILMPSDFFSAYDGLLDAIKDNRISPERIDQSLERIILLKFAYLSDQFDEATQDAILQCQQLVEMGDAQFG